MTESTAKHPAPDLARHTLAPFPLASGFSGQRRARATSASLHPPLVDLLSLLAFVLLTRPCALLPLFPFLIPSFLSCLDFLTEDCQGFQLFLSRSFPPYCTLLPHRLGRRFICAVLFVFLSCALFLLLPVKVLELPGQRRVRFFNTSSLPPFVLVLFWSLSVLLVLVLGFPSLLTSTLCIGTDRSA